MTAFSPFPGRDPMTTILLRRAFERQSLVVPDAAPEDEPVDPDSPSFRRIVRVDSVPLVQRPPPLTLEAARDATMERVAKYLAERDPEYVLLVALPAGTGKTTLAREVAELFALAEQRVGYLMPTHQMARDLIASSSRPDLFYEWSARQLGSADGLKRETCKHAPWMAKWLERGYDAIDLCAAAEGCGWDFVKYGCVFHGQEREADEQGARIIIGQHAHLVFGHPMAPKFDVAIGDESPLNAIPHVWKIPHDMIVPNGLDLRDGLNDLLWKLQSFASRGERLYGRTLLDALGGPAAVLAALEDFRADPETALPWVQAPRQVEQVANVDYFHLPDLVKLLRAEAGAADEGRDFAPRVFVESVPAPDGSSRVIGGLHLLKRHAVRWRDPMDSERKGWPRRCVWLDATADARFYETIFGRPVEVFKPHVVAHQMVVQVHDRSNGIGSLFMVDDKERGRRKALASAVDDELDPVDPSTDPAKAGADLVELVRYLSWRARIEDKTVGVISFKRLRDRLVPFCTLSPTSGKPMFEHFGNLRGSNAFVGVDVLIVAGAPQPPPEDVERTATCLLTPQRIDSFRGPDGKLPRSVELRAYQFRGENGDQYGYPTSGYWTDPDLTALLWQSREAEVIQAVNRARGVLRSASDPATVYLITNLPIDDVPPSRLVSVAELYDAPTGPQGQPMVDPYEWGKAVIYAYDVAQERGWLETRDLVDHLGLSRSTAGKYIDWMIERYPTWWKDPDPRERVILARGKRGRPPAHLAITEGWRNTLTP